MSAWLTDYRPPVVTVAVVTAAISGLVLLAGCEKPIGRAYPCTQKATGRVVQAQRGNLTGWLVYRDANGLDQVISSSNSDQWSCDLKGER